MSENIKRFFKVYPLPTFVLVLTFVIYYFAFDFLNKEENNDIIAVTEEESMRNNEIKSEPAIESPIISATTIEPSINTQNTVVIEQQNSEENNVENTEIAQNNEIDSTSKPPLPEVATKTYVTTTSTSLNIRKEPSTTAQVVGRLTPQQRMILLREENEWIFIADSRTEEPVGWIFKQFARILESTPAQQVTQIDTPPPNLPQTNLTDRETFTSRVSSLNIREYPSTDAPIAGKLTPNDSVFITETRNEWVKITDANTPSRKNGWVVRRSLTTR